MTAGTRELRGNSPLLLGPESTAWRVAAGRAQVFALISVLADDDPPGNGAVVERIPLFALDQGDWAFPVPGVQEGASGGFRSAGLLLVALEDGTELEPMGRPWASVSIPDRPAEPQSRIAELRRAA